MVRRRGGGALGRPGRRGMEVPVDREKKSAPAEENQNGCDSGSRRTSHGVNESGLAAAGDAELLDLARGGDGDAIGRRAMSVLLERYQERVYLWCLRMVRDHEKALDLAQEVLISAYRRLDTFEERSGFSSWLFAIARNRCLSALRRPSLWRDDEEAIENCADPGPEPDRELEEKLDEEEILALVREHLDPLEQKAIWLRCFEEMPVEEITRLLGLESASGARGLLQRARRKLQAARLGRRSSPPRSRGRDPEA
jgi:RNA polymerase sigma-70 factor, ECF subfamily